MGADWCEHCIWTIGTKRQWTIRHNRCWNLILPMRNPERVDACRRMGRRTCWCAAHILWMLRSMRDASHWSKLAFAFFAWASHYINCTCVSQTFLFAERFFSRSLPLIIRSGLKRKIGSSCLFFQIAETFFNRTFFVAVEMTSTHSKTELNDEQLQTLVTLTKQSEDEVRRSFSKYTRID